MTDTRVHTIIDSPIGPLTLVSNGTHLVGLYMENQQHLPEADRFGEREDSAAPFPETTRQLGEYFAGTRTDFDLPLAPEGTDFQQSVWAVLRTIPYGQTRTYGDVAGELGKPGASRAVGLANGRNPMCIVVPCHRIVGSSGSLTGFAGGVERKKALLDLERSNSASA